MIKSYMLPSLTILLLTIIISCNGEKMGKNNIYHDVLKDVPASAWEDLSTKKIYFGHRSVGNNIIKGIFDLMTENPKINLNIVETTDLAHFNAGVFAHSKIGENGIPQSKTDSFMKYMEQGIGNNVNIAFFKFCFADIKAETAIQEIFSDYNFVMSKLKAQFPETTFIHITVPLQTTKTTLKTWVKKLTRKEFIWEYDHNVARNEFNELLRKKYQGKEPVFDLAKIESTLSDGTESSFTRNRKIYNSLFHGYTHDGGHLNEVGRKKVAKELLLLLINLD